MHVAMHGSMCAQLSRRNCIPSALAVKSSGDVYIDGRGVHGIGHDIDGEDVDVSENGRRDSDDCAGCYACLR